MNKEKLYNIQVNAEFVEAIASAIKSDKKELEPETVKRFYAVDQVANMTNKHAVTIRRHIKKGILIAKQVGKCYLISEEDLQSYLQNKSN